MILSSFLLALFTYFENIQKSLYAVCRYKTITTICETTFFNKQKIAANLKNALIWPVLTLH